MPTYEYGCPDCGYEFEQYQKMSDDRLSVCPSCHKETLKRKIGSGAGIIFKGSGFYCTDYKGGNASVPATKAGHNHDCASCCSGGGVPACEKAAK